jgi:lipopolysaccharide export system permease protein
VKHTVTEATLAAAIREGTFVHAGDITLLADHVTVRDEQIRLSNVFVRQDEGDRSSVISAHTALLLQLPDDTQPTLLLRDGEATLFDAEGRQTGRAAFREARWPLDIPGLQRYPRRGLDARELTLPELWRALIDPPEKPTPPEVSAEWNMRLVMIASLPVLPLAAMSLGLGSPRQARRYGIAIGFALVILYFQAIGFGEQMVKRSILPASVALWAPFGTFGMLVAAHFCRIILGIPSRRPLRLQLSGGGGRHSLGSGK